MQGNIFYNTPALQSVACSISSSRDDCCFMLYINLVNCRVWEVMWGLPV